MEVFNMSLQPEAYYSVDDFGDTMLRTLFTSLFGVLMMLWVQLFSISYLRVLLGSLSGWYCGTHYSG